MSAFPTHLHSSAIKSESNTVAQCVGVLERLNALLQSVYRTANSNAAFTDDAQFEAWFKELIQALQKLQQQRPSELLSLDTQRKAQPHWFTESSMIGYSAYVDRFGGDFRGVAQRAEYLHELGVKYLHLLPFLEPRNGDNDGGFAVRNFEKVDSRFGNEQDLIELTTHLRKYGISLCSDLVLNHIADDHAWAIAAKHGDAKYQKFFHVISNEHDVESFEQHLGQVFPQTAPGNFTYVPQMNGYVWTTFYPYQWDLNWANPDVFAAMATTLVRLANLGIEVFRLDSVPFLWKQSGTDCMNLPQAHQLVQALRCITEYACSGVLLKAEAIVPTAHLPAYLGKVADNPAVQECHIAYHSGLMAASWLALATQDTRVLNQVMLTTPDQPQCTSWLTYVRCHDDIIWSSLRPEIEALNLSFNQVMLPAVQWLTGVSPNSYARGLVSQNADPNVIHGTNGMAASLMGIDQVRSLPVESQLSEQAIDRMMLLHAVAFSFGGMPVLYSGDELAQPNYSGQDAQAQIAQDGRWLQRPYFDDALLAHPLHQTMLEKMKHLVKVRAQQVAFDACKPRKTVQWLQQPNAVVAFLRGASESEPVLCMFNFSEQIHVLNLTDVLASANLKGVGSWLDSYSNQMQAQHIRLQPWQFMWLVTPTPSIENGV